MEWCRVADNVMEVSELFASVQGEGPRAGVCSLFLRLRRCNLSCIWCDTRYTWDANDPGFQEYEELGIGEVAGRIVRTAYTALPHELVRQWESSVGLLRDQRPTNLVITGGEPLIWRNAIRDVLSRGLGLIRTVEIETNGTVPPTIPEVLERHWDLQYNVSPKLPGAGNMGLLVWNEQVMRAFTQKQSVFKLVVSAIDTLENVGATVAWLLGAGVPDERVWLMPEGRSEEALAENIPRTKEMADMLGVRFTNRLHVLAFGDTKGT